MRTRPVFESFYSFVDFLNESINGEHYEDYLLEGDNIDDLTSEETGKLSEFSNTLRGMEGIDKGEQKNVDRIVAAFAPMATEEAAGVLEKYAQTIASFAASTKGGVKVTWHGFNTAVPGTGKEFYGNGGKYSWLVNGTCKVNGQPPLNDEGVVTDTNTTLDDGGKDYYPISDVLIGILQRNMKALSDVLKTKDEETIKKAANGGKKGKDGLIKEKKLLTIDPQSISTRILEVVPFKKEFHPRAQKFEKEGPEDSYVASSSSKRVEAFQMPGSVGVKTKLKQKVDFDRFEYGFIIPLWVLIPKSIKASKNKIDEKTYTTILPPVQGTGIEIKDKPFIGPGDAQYFKEGSITLSQGGIDGIKGMLSEFNSVEKIVVIGGASQKPTNYVSPNEETKKAITQENSKAEKVLIGNGYLAYDRALAGVSALEKMKESGAEQLKNCTIEKGTPEEILKNVQAIDAESDPKMQQIKFMITGVIKGYNPVPQNAEPTIIKQVKDIKAQEVKLSCIYYFLGVNMK